MLLILMFLLYRLITIAKKDINSITGYYLENDLYSSLRKIERVSNDHVEEIIKDFYERWYGVVGYRQLIRATDLLKKAANSLNDAAKIS